MSDAVEIAKPVAREQIERDLYEIEHDPSLAPEYVDARLAALAFGFQVASEADAAWAVRRMVRDEQDIDALDEVYREARVNLAKKRDWRKKVYGAKLEEWARQNITGKKRSRAVIGPDGSAGVLGFRRAPAKLDIEAEDAVRTWAEANLPEAINYARAPLAKTIIDEWSAKHGGETPPGVRRIEEHDAFFVRGE